MEAGVKAGSNSRTRRSPLTAKLSVLPCKSGEEFIRRLFEPLGYQVQTHHHVLDERFPEWGESPYYTVELKAQTRLQDLLTHLLRAGAGAGRREALLGRRR